VAKQKEPPPQVYDGKKQKWVNPTRGRCHQCGKQKYIAIRSALGAKCFDCFAEAEKAWGNEGGE
jgi:hypothetical protein